MARWRRPLVVAVLAATLAACGGDGRRPAAGAPPAGEPVETTSTLPPEPVSTVNLFAIEYTYDADAPGAVAAGPVTFTIRNLGQEQHNAQLLRLDDGVDEQEMVRAAKGDPTGAELLALGETAGGTGPVGPGGVTRGTFDLAPGSYTMFCTVRGPAGETHASAGMLVTFEVVDEGEPGEAPQRTATAGMVDFGFEVPSRLPAEGVLEVANRGKVPHELALYRLPEGSGTRRTLDDYLKAIQEERHPPPPFPAGGGVAALPPGASAKVGLNLQPGRYLLLCLLPDAKGKLHASRGMRTQVTVG